MDDPRLTAFAEREEAAAAAAEALRDQLTRAIEARGRATFAASGGTTPGGAYEALSLSDVDWTRVTVGLVDERWVPPAHDRSNEAIVRRTLLRGRAETARFLPMWREGSGPSEAAGAVDAAYGELDAPMDAVLLGMGADGHTASWFPGADGLEEALDLVSRKRVVALSAPAGGAAEPILTRLTLTLPALARARAVTLLIFGDDKRAVLAEAPAKDLPVARALAACGPRLAIFWAP